jgi:hypothetical protein
MHGAYGEKYVSSICPSSSFLLGTAAIWGIQRLVGEEIWGDMGEYKSSVILNQQKKIIDRPIYLG